MKNLIEKLLTKYNLIGFAANDFGRHYGLAYFPGSAHVLVVTQNLDSEKIQVHIASIHRQTKGVVKSDPSIVKIVKIRTKNIWHTKSLDKELTLYGLEKECLISELPSVFTKYALYQQTVHQAGNAKVKKLLSLYIPSAIENIHKITARLLPKERLSCHLGTILTGRLSFEYQQELPKTYQASRLRILQKAESVTDTLKHDSLFAVSLQLHLAHKKSQESKLKLYGCTFLNPISNVSDLAWLPLKRKGKFESKDIDNFLELVRSKVSSEIQIMDTENQTRSSALGLTHQQPMLSTVELA